VNTQGSLRLVQRISSHRPHFGVQGCLVVVDTLVDAIDNVLADTLRVAFTELATPGTAWR
jgi:hypothetical protein